MNDGAEPKRSWSRVTPMRVVTLGSLLYLAAIPFDWVEGTSSVGSVGFSGIEVIVFALCSVSATAVTLLAGWLMRRGRRGLALLVATFASGLSLLFALSSMVAIGLIKGMVNAFVPDEIATASVGPAIWMVAAAAVVSFAGVVWGLTRSPEELGQGASLRQWLTLPKALGRAARVHLSAPAE